MVRDDGALAVRGRIAPPRRANDSKDPFRDAVPRRADRRGLRQLVRHAARSESSVADRHVTETLNQLANSRVPVATVWVQPDHREVVQFSDGTELVVDVVGNTPMIDRMPGGRYRGVRLGQASPCMGRNWFLLWFVPPHGEAVEIMAKVASYKPTSAAPSETARRRWPRAGRGS